MFICALEYKCKDATYCVIYIVCPFQNIIFSLGPHLTLSPSFINYQGFFIVSAFQMEFLSKTRACARDDHYNTAGKKNVIILEGLFQSPSLLPLLFLSQNE